MPQPRNSTLHLDGVVYVDDGGDVVNNDVDNDVDASCAFDWKPGHGTMGLVQEQAFDKKYWPSIDFEDRSPNQDW